MITQQTNSDGATLPKPQLTRSQRRVLAASMQPIQRTPRLSAVEYRVFRLIGLGMTTREIAAAVHRSPKTIETHIEHLKTKLDCKNRHQLTRCAVIHFLEVSHETH